jgi:hypothetical protein
MCVACITPRHLEQLNQQRYAGRRSGENKWECVLGHVRAIYRKRSFLDYAALHLIAMLTVLLGFCTP